MHHDNQAGSASNYKFEQANQIAGILLSYYEARRCPPVNALLAGFQLSKIFLTKLLFAGAIYSRFEINFGSFPLAYFPE